MSQFLRRVHKWRVDPHFVELRADLLELFDHDSGDDAMPGWPAVVGGAVSTEHPAVLHHSLCVFRLHGCRCRAAAVFPNAGHWRRHLCSCLRPRCDAGLSHASLSIRPAIVCGALQLERDHADEHHDANLPVADRASRRPGRFAVDDDGEHLRARVHADVVDRERHGHVPRGILRLVAADAHGDADMPDADRAARCADLRSVEPAERPVWVMRAGLHPRSEPSHDKPTDMPRELLRFVDRNAGVHGKHELRGGRRHVRVVVHAVVESAPRRMLACVRADAFAVAHESTELPAELLRLVDAIADVLR